jgi:DNA mismatch repair protein MSH4
MAINHVLMIKAFVSAVPALHEALAAAGTDLLQRIRGTCCLDLIQPVTDLINNTINEDVKYVKTPLDLRHQRTYAVKVHVSVLIILGPANIITVWGPWNA